MPKFRDGPKRLGWVCASLALALLLEYSLVAQQRFEGAVDRVVVDFLATGKDGTPIRDLAVTEINLQVDGKQRSIATLDLVDLGRAAAASSQASGVSPNGNTNAREIPSGGRKFFLVFDEDSMRPGEEREPQQSGIRFVQRLHPADQVSVLALPGGNVATELTTDRSITIRALEGILGRMPQPPQTREEAVSRACADYFRTRVTLSKLSDLMRSLHQLDGAKFVVLTTSGVLPQGAERPPGSPACATLTVDPERFQELGMLAMAARAQFFVIQPHGFLLDASVQRMPTFFGHPADDNVGSYLADQLGGLRDVAGVTGGESFRLSGFGDPVFAKIERETSAHYLLSFAPIAAERDNKLHKIAVTTRRTAVDLRARPTFRLPKV